MRRIALVAAVVLGLLASLAPTVSLAGTHTPITATVKPVTPAANRTSKHAKAPSAAARKRAAARRAAAKRAAARKAAAKRAAAKKAAAKKAAEAKRGKTGKTGKTGAQGPPGTTGAAGAAGAAGTPGVAGTPGQDGQDGANGAPGQNGAPGANGAPGQDGTPGKDGAPPAPDPAPVQLRVLGINDFHGNLEPPSGSSGAIPTGTTGPNGTGAVVNATTGGAAYLATKVKQLSAGVNSTFVGSGDLIGASPLISGLLHDEPTVEALNGMGLEFAGVGNHEFDEGIDELERMQFGGCSTTDPQNSCQGGGTFTGAFYRYLASNVRYKGTSQTIFPPYLIKKTGGIPVAYIGSVLQGTPAIVTPDGVKGLTFDDEAQTINRLVKELADSQNVQTFVVLIHQGGQQNPPFSGGYVDRNKCENPTGDIFNIVPKLDPRVDVVLSAHTHQQYICQQGNTLVTSAASFGRLVTKVDLTLSPVTNDVLTKTATNELVTRDVPADPATQQLIDKYKNVVGPKAARVVGSITNTIGRTSATNDEQPLGDVIADSQLDATSPTSLGGSVVAFMNPGGIRADLTYTATDGKPQNVTYNDIYTVQPFANTLTVKTLTGAQLDALLEQQFNNPSAGANRFLQVSRGFTYSYDLTRPTGDRVDPSTIKINGTTVGATTSYRVTMNNFLASGGDGFTVFNQGTDQLGGAVDIDAFEKYITANSPLSSPAPSRITRVG